jgi:hypothetical protein
MPRWLSKITSRINASNDHDIINLAMFQRKGVFFSNVPDYSKIENINLCPGNGQTFTIDRDGFVLCNELTTGVSPSHEFKIFVNNLQVYTGSISTTNWGNNFAAPFAVKAGDIIMLASTVTAAIYQCYYIPPIKSTAGDYSTTETNTGQRWIDGKDIYRIVVDTLFGPTKNTFNVVGNIPNIDTVIYLDGMSRDGSVNNPINHMPVLFYGVYEQVGSRLHITPSGDIVEIHTTGWDNCTLRIIAEYTKI